MKNKEKAYSFRIISKEENTVRIFHAANHFLASELAFESSCQKGDVSIIFFSKTLGKSNKITRHFN